MVATTKADRSWTPGRRKGATGESQLDQTLEGLDRLDTILPKPPSAARRAWSAVWPKVAAIAIGVSIWQIIVWTGWKPTYLLPGPVAVARAIGSDRSVLFSGSLTTLGRAIEGYLIAMVIGTLVAIAITRVRLIRSAVNPLITGLQTMPSVAWVPLAILLFGLSSQAVIFVTVIGSAPAFAIGAIAGIDAVPPILHRAGTILGARGWRRYWYIILPGALPGYVTGMKQAWAFAWRSVMAAELIDQVTGHQALGRLLSTYQDQSLSADVLGVMVVILFIGLLLDSVLFGRLERAVMTRRGLVMPGSR